MVTIDNIIAFTKKAMKNNLYVESYLNDGIDFGNDMYFQNYITIRNEKEGISIEISSDRIRLLTSCSNTNIKTLLTEREKVNLKSLHLDVEEYCRERALRKFETFFNEINKLSDIDDLDNEDD